MLQINLSHLIAELGWDAEFGEKKKKGYYKTINLI